MIPIRLTDNHYINPSAVLHVEFTPKGKIGPDAHFYALYGTNDDFGLRLTGAEAEEAFRNWTDAVALQHTAAPVQPTLADQYQNELTAQIMRPEHPQWPDFYSRLKAAFASDTGMGEFTPLIRRILEEMGFTNFDIELTVLYLFKRWALQL